MFPSPIRAFRFVKALVLPNFRDLGDLQAAIQCLAHAQPVGQPAPGSRKASDLK
jgi:hypothetical protein